MGMQRCYIAVGGNIHPEYSIPRALDLLHDVCPIQGLSTFYRTDPVDRPEQSPYLNGVVMIRYGEHPRALKYDILRPIEAALGRVRTEDAYAARPIDLDILLCGVMEIQEPGLILPDPDIRERVFLAVGLVELEPEMKLPGTNISVAALFSRQDRDALVPDVLFTRTLRERFYV